MSVSPALIITIIAVAIALVLLLVAFGSRLPERMRQIVELLVSVGYPAVVGLLFVGLGLERYQSGETTPAIGFGVGALLMVLLTVRAIRRQSKA
ncbi:hypothetical protein [Brevundimonas sp.]|uniref:hypothetical protein n=1 Tax=Brevundimonas sp. TaxID=1871086 RepID=UPI0028A040BC|nr:hypothetical protein [Brevundimonas sp.]